MRKNIAFPMCRPDRRFEIAGGIGETKNAVPFGNRSHIGGTVIPIQALHHDFTTVRKFGSS